MLILLKDYLRRFQLIRNRPIETLAQQLARLLKFMITFACFLLEQVNRIARSVEKR